ncbi:M16 family metallopeptidase [Merismopedia glauca]|uniref:Peptidase M16 n=1 Tax=Merismopedia glauca CCAP 1448/3 TaxID=1296344 RepID=A0A2T1C3R1_9CYAN|nr:pitrilysin family protein [Merismopedia glauca]PSB02854.1 peptidase M16 [Merismopedia glauca CCAP 1448/3]
MNLRFILFPKWLRRRWSVATFSLCLILVLLLGGGNSVLFAFADESRISNSVESVSLTKNARRTRLANGLTILTKEVHTAPIVTVQVWYKVGSRNEAPGVNGIAHQLEHMLFKGTKDRPIQFGRLFSALGSDSNAFTSYDMTAYFGTVERNKLKALMEIEADRMKNSVIDDKKLESEKRVVISELQGYENGPGYRLSRAVKRDAFPNHPYGLTVGGTKADVEKFTPEQVKSYYNRFYSPDNATLVIVGDFETEATLKAAKDIFGKIPKHQSSTSEKLGNTIPKLETTIKPPLEGKVKPPIVLKEPGSAALLEAVYPAPDVNNPDVPALDVMNYILTEGRNSRLYEPLIESGLASGIDGGVANLISGGWAEFSATATPGKKLPDIDGAILQTIETLQTKGVTLEEVNRAKAQLTASAILGNRDINSQAQQLGNDQTVTGDYQFTDKYLAGVQKVTPADVKRVANKYLKPSLRTVGYFEPTQISGKPGSQATNSSQTSESFNAGPPVDPAEVAKYLPKIDSETVSSTQSLPQTFELKNGLKVLLLKDTSTPTVSLSGYIQAGTEFDAAEKSGLASLTADNLTNGTKTRDALTIAKILADRGAQLGASANREGVSIGGRALARDLPILVDVLADLTQNAIFPTQELELSRQRALTSLKLELDNPGRVGRRTFQQQVYPKNHPFYNFPTEASLKAISREDLVNFYQQHYAPNNMTLAIAGDFSPKQVRSLLESKFGSWKKTTQTSSSTLPEVKLPAKTVRLNPTLPGKTQSISILGYQGISRRDPQFYPALVMNDMLGGSTLSSRLGSEIRDRLGLTYGIYSVFATGRYPGPFFIQMQTAPEDAQKAVDSTINVLKQIRSQGFSVEEINAAKSSLASSYNVEIADPDALISTILSNQVYGLSKEEIRDFSRKIQEVTPEQVNQATKDLLHPDNLVIVTVGPPLS